MSEGSLIRSTLRALVEPRRLVPILAVCIPIVAVQHNFSADRLGLPLGILMCVMFVLIAPVSYRVLFPEGLEFSHGAVRLVLYGTIGCGVVLVVGAVIPKVLDMGQTFLTNRSSLAVCAALFLVGGWGLGRDVGFEASLARERARAAAYLREAELSQLVALRSHLDPHFLFNTLNAIAEWCREDGEVAERAVLQLSSILRTVLAGVREKAWPLSQELDLVRTLFALHLLRDPHRFTLRVEVEEPAQAVLVPPLLLLPLAENAVKHGPAAGHGGEILLKVAREGGALCVALVNPGDYRGPREGSHGLPTVEKRLALAYAGAGQLRIEGDGGKTEVRLSLPIEGPVPGVMT